MTICKRLFCLALAALVFLLAACGGGEGASGVSSASVSSSATEAASSAAASSAAPSVSGAPVGELPASTAPPPAPPPGPAPGRYEHFEEKRFPDERAPYLVLEENGQALFRLNTGMELAEVRGSYAVSGSTLVFTVTSLQTQEGFAGEETGQLTFDILSPDHLRYSGDSFGLTLDGNIFTREGAAPYVPASLPASSAAVPVSSAPSASPAASAAPSSSQAPAAGSAAASQSPGSESAGPAQEEENASSPVIEPEKGFSLWMMVLVAGASLVLGGGGALAALVALRRRGKKVREAEAEAGLPENAGKAQRKALKKAQAQEKKAERAAQKSQKKAEAAEKKAQRAAEKARQAGSAAQQAGAAAEEAGANVRKTASAEEAPPSQPAQEAGRDDSPAPESAFGEAKPGRNDKPPPPPGSQVVLE